MIDLYQGDCLEVMRALPSDSIDSIVTDPPYGISFMAKRWDYDVPGVEVWGEVLRVLKPGGHALIACGTRTQHRMVVNIEDAGFEIRDVVSWIYGSGFPKSLNIGKAMDKVLGKQAKGFSQAGDDGRKAEFKQDKSFRSDYGYKFEPESDEAKQWDGWGTALKPACEFFTLARKPLSEKTVAKNVLRWGTGGINVDGCRVAISNSDDIHAKNPHTVTKGGGITATGLKAKEYTVPQGRFPANLIHDGSQEVLDLFPETKPSRVGNRGLDTGIQGGKFAAGDRKPFVDKISGHSDNGGSAARFFYCAKASKKDRDEGLEGEEKECKVKNDSGRGFSEGDPYRKVLKKNHHPTVKPTALMRYLCKLITPPGGTVLDPYMGSGSTGKAAILEGFSFVGCELDEDYFKIAQSRIEGLPLNQRLSFL